MESVPALDACKAASVTVVVLCKSKGELDQGVDKLAWKSEKVSDEMFEKVSGDTMHNKGSAKRQRVRGSVGEELFVYNARGSVGQEYRRIAQARFDMQFN